jgi:hypothetical protein
VGVAVYGRWALQVRALHAKLRRRRGQVEEELQALDAVRLRLRMATGTCSAPEGRRLLRTTASLGGAISVRAPAATARPPSPFRPS